MTIHDIYFETCRKHVNLENKDERTIVLMQVGNFYEAYSHPNGIGSAETLSKALNIHLTKKSGKLDFSERNPKMAGFPLFHLEKHLNILLDNNYKVVIYEQNENDCKKRQYKGTFTKNIRYEFPDTVSVLTSKKIYSGILEKYKVLKTNKSCYEYRLSYVYLELTTGQLFFSETTDDSFLRCVEQFLIQNQPHEMLFHITTNFNKEEITELRTIIKNTNENEIEINIYKPIKDFTIIENKIDQCFTSKKKPENLQYYPEIANNIYKLLEYVQEHDPSQVKNLSVTDNPWLEIENNHHMRLNRDVYRELFIFNDKMDDRSNNENHLKYKSVFDLLSEGMNAMGKRKLLQNLKRPLTNKDEISKRYSAIENCEKDKLFLSHTIDIESYFLKWKRSNLSLRLVTRLIQEYINLSKFYDDINDFLQYVESIWHLEKMENDDDADFFRNTTQDYNDWCREFNDILYEVLILERHDSNFIWVEDKKDIQDSFFQITTTKWNKLDSSYKNKFRIISSKSQSKHVMMSSFDNHLLKLQILKRKIKLYKEQLYKEQCHYIFEKYDNLLYNFHEKIGFDSMNTCLKDYFKKNNYIKPIIEANSQESFFSLEKVRHPIIEKIFHNEVFVPFNASLCDRYTGQLIYGMNSSGKSTYKKSIATSIYLAQCGLFVPAKKMTYTPYLALFSKLNHSDNLYKKQSLFVNEIQELKYILERVSPSKSLLFLDELFSGTELYSTFGLLLGIIKELVAKRIHFFLTTHIHCVADAVEDEFGKRIKINHFKMKKLEYRSEDLCTSDVNLFYNREMAEGSGESIYGVELAEALNLNSNVTEFAKDFRKHIEITYHRKNKKKRSKYNKNLEIYECEICKSRKNLETHHILQQQNFKDSTKIEGLDKNALQNLMVLCEDCHKKIEGKKNNKN